MYILYIMYGCIYLIKSIYVKVITHPWGLYFICKRDAQGCSLKINQIQTKWMCYNCFVLWCLSGSKAPLACVWHEEQFYTAGPVPRNSVGGLVDGKPWVSMPLSWNGITMPTRVANLAFRISTNVSLALLNSWLLELYARSVLCIMANWTCMALQQSSAKPSLCIV